MTRQARPTQQFFDALAEELPEHRTASRPSRWDFLARHLADILKRVGTEWESLAPLFGGHPGYRQLMDASDLGLAYRVECQLALDGAVELVHVEIDVAPPWTGDEPSVDI